MNLNDIAIVFLIGVVIYLFLFISADVLASIVEKHEYREVLSFQDRIQNKK